MRSSQNTLSKIAFLGSIIAILLLITFAYFVPHALAPLHEGHATGEYLSILSGLSSLATDHGFGVMRVLLPALVAASIWRWRIVRHMDQKEPTSPT
jgi:hypothetical protein